MTNILAAAVLLVIVGLAAGYVIRAKKNGKKCIGCPGSGNCSQNCDDSGCCGCSGCGKG